MASQIFLYPTFSDSDKYGLKLLKKGWSIYYHNKDGELTQLNYKPAEINNNLNCIETDGIWNVDTSDICFSNKIVIDHYRNLFGPSGIACKSAKLGLSVAWSSADSRQRGTKKIGTFSVNANDYKSDEDKTTAEIGFDISFHAASLRGDVSFSIVIYVDKAGVPEPGENHLANVEGFILGTIDSFTIRLDGTGSVFPVFEIYDKNKPLWYVRCDWVDPLSDSFSENVSININTAHKEYKYLDQTQKTFCKQLLVEVMSSAVCCIIEEARGSVYWDQIIDDDTHEHGSVAEVIRYFKDALGWDLSSPKTVSLSSRSFFDGRMS